MFVSVMANNLKQKKTYNTCVKSTKERNYQRLADKGHNNKDLNLLRELPHGWPINKCKAHKLHQRYTFTLVLFWLVSNQDDLCSFNADSRTKLTKDQSMTARR